MEKKKVENLSNEGIMETHIQISDAYREGTIEANINNVDGETVDVPNTGYEGSQ